MARRKKKAVDGDAPHPRARRTPDEGRFSNVSRRMWNDAKFRALSAPPPNGQTLWFRLLTGPELGPIPGVFSVGEMALAEALGWPLEGFREAFAEAFRQGLVQADFGARFVWVPNALKHNRPQSKNVILSWRAAWIELPECRLKHEAWRAFVAFLEGYGEGFAEAFRKACPKACDIQEQEQEQDHLEEDPPPPPRGRNGPFGVPEPVPGSTEPAPPELPSRPSGVWSAKRAVGTRRAEQAIFAEAFARARQSVRPGAYAVPPGEVRALDDAIDTHAPTRNTAERESWLEATAAKFFAVVFAEPDALAFWRGGSDPSGFLRWLNAGQPATIRPPPAKTRPGEILQPAPEDADWMREWGGGKR